MYKIFKRKMTIKDFLKLKKYKPMKDNRQSSKSINFGSIFGAIGATLGKSMQASGFTEKDCDNAIELFSLEKAFNTAVFSQKNVGKKKKDVKYIIVGNKFRELFFQSYPGLMARIEREQKFGTKYGYVRTWTGPVRHLAELVYMNKNDKGPQGADSILYSKAFAHAKNEACNTTIQTAEVYWAMPNATAFNYYMKKWNYKSRIWNYTHDSFEFYCYKPEREICYALLNRLCQINRQPYYGIPMEMSVEESDLNNPDEYLKHGREIEIKKYKLPEELENDFDENIIPIFGKVI